MGLGVSGGDRSLEYHASLDTNPFLDGIKKINASLGSTLAQLSGTNSEIAKTFENLTSRATLAIGSYISFAAGKQIITDVVRVRAEFQQLEVAFQTMLGSKEKADQLMQDVAQFASTTPFQLSEVAAATKSLLAFGVAAGDIRPTLKALGDISAGVGAPLKEIAELYGKAKTQGRLFAEDINQLTGRGIPIIQELAKQFGVTDDKVKGLVEAGKVGFPQLEAAFQTMTAEGSKFGGLMEAQSKTISGLLSNLSDAVDAVFNELGKSQEGLISESISVVIILVQNYQKVIDILEIAAATYGTYKTALLLTNVASTSLGVTTKGLTAAQILQAGATGIANKTMALLNRTMLANPAVALATLIGGLIATMVVFREKTIEVKTSQELLADAQKNVGDRLAETQAKILPYAEALKGSNVSEAQRLDIYNKLKEIDPKIVSGLDAKTISYERLKKNADLYLDSLRNQLKLEANESAAKESIKQEQAFQNYLDQRKEKLDQLQKKQKEVGNQTYNPYGGSGAGVALALEIKQVTAQISTYEDLLHKQQKITEKFGQSAAPPPPPPPSGKDVVAIRNEAFIKNEIERITKLREPLAIASREYKQHTKEIEALQNELNPQKVQKAAEAQENKRNEILDKRRSILEEIASLQSGAGKTGLSKEQQEIDQLTQKYQAALEKVVAFNSERKNAGHQIDVVEIIKLGAASAVETQNVLSRQQSEVYIKSLEEQKKAFEQFENDKKSLGTQRAEEMYANQTKGFKSYLDYLQSEYSKVELEEGPGADEKRKKIAEEIVSEKNERRKSQIEDYKNLLVLTQNFNIQKEAIARKYDALEKALISKRSQITEQEYQKNLSTIKQFRQEELSNLANSVTRQSALYKKLNQDIINFSAAALKREAFDLQNQLKNDTSLSPAMKAEIQSRIDQLLSLVHNTDAASQKVLKTSENFGAASTALGSLSTSLQSVNAELSHTLSVLSTITASVSGALKSFDDFKAADTSGNVAGQIAAASGMIGAAVTAVNAIVNVFVKAKQSAVEARREMESFQFSQATGELEINLAYRERLRTQQDINDLKLEGIRKENAELAKQRKANEDDYKNLLSQIQNEKYISGQHTSRSAGSGLFGAIGALTGIGATTSVVKEYTSLANKSYEDLEKLFMSGQLDGKAKELFQTLQKLKQEGADIDKALEENRRNAQQMFTGTTAESIVSTISDGFAQGFRSVEQFAGKTEDIIRGAMLKALEARALEGPLKKIYEQLAIDAESDGGLDQAEVANFENSIKKTIENAALIAAQIEKASGVNLSNATTAANGENNFAGAIKAISSQQADVIAGNMNGLRLSNLEILDVVNHQLAVQNKIEVNTRATNQYLADYFRKWDSTGLPVVLR